MTEEHSDQMRAYIVLAEAMIADARNQTEEIVEKVVMENEEHTPVILADLEALAFKLRGFMEDSGGEYALGFEAGMQRAADMIENLVRRYNEGGHIE